jgi:hypothetical protein
VRGACAVCVCVCARVVCVRVCLGSLAWLAVVCVCVCCVQYSVASGVRGARRVCG